MIEPLVAFSMKEGDRFPSLRTRLTRLSDGTPYSFAGATVKFYMYDLNGTKLIDANATVESLGATGIVRYDWGAGETDRRGDFLAEFRVDFGGGSYLTVPNDGYIKITFIEKLPQQT